MGLRDFVEEEEEQENDSQEQSHDDSLGGVQDAGEESESLRDKQLKDTSMFLLLRRYDPKDGKYRGREPEDNGEVSGLTPHDNEWDDEWVYWQQDVELVADGKVFRLPCACGNEVRSGANLDYAVCTRCARVYILSTDVNKIEKVNDRDTSDKGQNETPDVSGGEQTGLEVFM